MLIDNALKVAEKAAEETIPMQAKKGRASYLGERSIGHKRSRQCLCGIDPPSAV